MKIKQIISVIILFILSLSFFVKKTWAITTGSRDLTITCTAASSQCTVSPSGRAMFDENNIVPGQVFHQKLIVNNVDNADDCNLTLTTKNETQSPANFATKLFTALKKGSSVLFGGFDESDDPDNTKNLANLFATTSFVNTTIASGETENIDWLVKLDPLTDNEYQGANTHFDFDIDAQCGEAPAPTPTPTVTPTTTSSTTTTSSSNTASAPTCSATAPTSAPGNLQIASSGPNTVTLSWSAVSPVTHYALIFTRSDGESYGSSNIGNTTNYTITNLPGGYSYTFEVFGVNDCAPGERSAVSSGNIGGAVFTGSATAPENRPVGEGGQVLGTQDSENGATVSATSNKTSEVLGDQDNQCKAILWWWPLLAQFIVIILLAIIFESLGLKILGIVVAMALSWWLHQSVGCGCSPNFWCNHYLWWNVIIAVLGFPLGNMLRSLFVDE